MSDKPDQRSKIGEWIGAAFDTMLHPPQQWEGSIHMAWGAINSKVVEICRKSRTDGIDGIIRDLEAAGFRAYYDRMSQCMEVAPPGPLDLRAESVPWIRGACEQMQELRELALRGPGCEFDGPAILAAEQDVLSMARAARMCLGPVAPPGVRT